MTTQYKGEEYIHGLPWVKDSSAVSGGSGSATRDAGNTKKARERGNLMRYK
jgi:hypothetical protein